jgi:hypothetical protein
MEYVTLVDSQEHRAALLAALIEDRVEDVRVQRCASLNEARWDQRPAAVVLNSLEPGPLGAIPPEVAAELAGIAFDGPGLVVICSAYLGDPVFETGVQRLTGPKSLVTVRRTLDWATRAVAAVDRHICALRAAEAWKSLFPHRDRMARSRTKIEPTTQLVLLKRLLKRGAVEKMAYDLPVRREFMIRPEAYLKGEDGYSLA